MSKKRKKTDPLPTGDADRAVTKMESAGETELPSGEESMSSPASRTQDAAPGESVFSRYFSFAMLLGVIVLVGVLFYEVMIGFFIPLFLAMILVVIFRPLHKWIEAKCNQRSALAALLTTTAVLIMVVVPLFAVLVMAFAEGQAVVRSFNVAQLSDQAVQIRSKLSLELPPQLKVMENEFSLLKEKTSLTVEVEDLHRTALFELESAARELSVNLELGWPDSPEEGASEDEGSSNENAQPLTGSINGVWNEIATEITALRTQHRSIKWEPSDDNDVYQEQMTEHRDYQLQLAETSDRFDEFKIALLGGKTRAWLTTMVNPSKEQTDQYLASAISYLRDQLFSLGGMGAAYAGKFLLGLAIMILAFYFFLLDGPGMLETFKGLSPIDDEHEQELVSEFGRVSRAVVIATLLSAIVQGLLAGIGFYFAGLESIFLLTVLSGVLAMVPFFGAASVWVPCALYLYFVDNNLTAAIGLTIYGTAVISMADNVIKPMVLHGQSNLHPLLAFLSVIGGVGALGPIGILIGPMIVAFLQTLLKILRQEMMLLGQAQPNQAEG